MKKILMALFLFALIFAFASCGGGSGAPSQSGGTADSTQSDGSTAGQPGSETGEAAMASLLDWMQAGTFSYDYKSSITNNGVTMESTGTIAADGGNFAMTSEMTVAGQNIETKIIVKDGFTYMVNDAEKTIIKFTGSNADLTGGVMEDYSHIQKVGSGTDVIDGRTLPYEEYAESNTGQSAKYFLDNGQVYGFTSESDNIETTLIISNAKDSVPTGVFDLPADYTQTQM